jgi:hypothetical protein
MSEKCDVLVTGTGMFAKRFTNDIALTAPKPIKITIAAREVEEGRQLEWLRQSGNARAAIAERPAFFDTTFINWESPESVAETIAEWDPDVIVHAASVQPSKVVIDTSEWGRLAAVGSMSSTVVVQALLGSRIGKAMALADSKATFMNCCYPDVTNAILKAMGYPVVSGGGNIEILASVFAGELGIRERGPIQVLAHHQNLKPFRGPAELRAGTPPPRVWIEGKEIDDVYERFSRVRLTRGPAIPISGCTAMPIILAYAGHRDYLGHVTGPHGLIGGYPATIKKGILELNLPDGLSCEEAIAWNVDFEKINGLTVENGRVVYHGPLHDELARHSPELAAGFHVDDLDRVFAETVALRERLEGQKAAVA